MSLHPPPWYTRVEHAKITMWASNGWRIAEFGNAEWDKETITRILGWANAPAPDKGSWEAVFGHMGTPDEVGNMWLAMSDRNDELEAALKEKS